MPVPSPGDLTDPGIELGTPALQADSLPFKPPGNPETLGRIIVNVLLNFNSGNIQIQIVRFSRV